MHKSKFTTLNETYQTGIFDDGNEEKDFLTNFLPPGPSFALFDFITVILHQKCCLVSFVKICEFQPVHFLCELRVEIRLPCCFFFSKYGGEYKVVTVIFQYVRKTT